MKACGCASRDPTPETPTPAPAAAGGTRSPASPLEEGNPDRPYIAGVKHDSAHTDHVTIQNHKRNVLRTPANNKNPAG